MYWKWDQMVVVAVIGAGSVSMALGRAFAAHGHEVVFGARDPDDPRHSALPRARRPPDAVTGAPVVVLTVPTAAVPGGFDVADLGGREHIALVEDHARLWIHLAFRRGWGRQFAFTVTRP
jgi:NAD(P)-dependent dehydrogenase (short-subunit alcohol dehydrogenase family)